MKRVLTIAGSDSLSGGGLQADLRTFTEYGLEASNVVTCLVGVDVNEDKVEIHEVSTQMLKHQLKKVEESNEIIGIKVGMLASIETGKLVASFLKTKETPIVIDPVLALKESGVESNQSVIEFFKKELLPLATITTPNLREAELLSGIDPIDSLEKMEEAAIRIYQTGVKNVVIKGGQRFEGTMAYDLLYDGEKSVILEQQKIKNGYNNGAGCTFASAICSGLAKGMDVLESVKAAKIFVYEAIEYGIPFLSELGNVYQGGKNKTIDEHNG